MNKERGVSSIEYGLLAALIAIAIIGVVQLVGVKSEIIYCNIASYLSGTGEAYYKCGSIINDNYASVVLANRSTTTGIICDPNANNAYYAYCPSFPSGEGYLVDNQLLETLNEKDPIVSIYGLYQGDALTGTPAVTYDDAQNAIRSGDLRTYGIHNQSLNEDFQYEIKTQSGSVYGVFWDGTNLGIRNLATNDTDLYDRNTRTYENVGITDMSGNSN